MDDNSRSCSGFGHALYVVDQKLRIRDLIRASYLAWLTLVVTQDVEACYERGSTFLVNNIFSE